ncbi:MAG: TIR domain-containing protein [Candidatus Ancillula sp.]|nr:TIR domain-containing protein [Candidatus Ancillula sp.]
MAHKTFISYKYSESQDLRDKIIKSLGDDATYYKGEDGFSDDLSDLKADTIKEYLKDMIWDTSVTIVALSPNLKQSDWVEWEIEYSLKKISRENRTSMPNGVVAILPNGMQLATNQVPSIITKNRYNKVGSFGVQNEIITTDSNLEESYISIVGESEFLGNPQKYIEDTYEKCQNIINYDITKQIKPPAVTSRTIRPEKPWRV